MGSISRAEEATLERALLAGYATVREPPERSGLDWHLAAALLGERALRAITRLRVPGLLCLPRLLADAEATAVEATAA